MGDDDVWVFLNGRLAVDLGGIHVPSESSVTINGAAGTVHARMQDLRGYGECGPECKLGPFCGDRIIQSDLGESCDDGPRGSSSCRGCRTVILR